MEAFFLELIKLSLIGSLLAAAVMLVRLFLPKTPKWIFCLLWGMVALRLICPVTVESRFSLIPDRISSGQIITSVASEYVGDVDIIHENDDGYDSAVAAGRQPVFSENGYYVVTEKDSLEVPKTVGETLYPVLSWVWVAGVALMLVYTLGSYLALRKKMAEATRLRDNIWQSEQVGSPFVLGFIKPMIYLPYQISDSDMANVIAHEKAHIQRKDHWWKPIGFILLSVYWFNPVLWLAYVMLCRDIEGACDEKVIRRMEKEEIRAYSTALLNCSVNRRRIAACPLAFGEVGVKERVKTVMNYKKPTFWIIIAAVAICIVVAVCFLTNPVNPNNKIDDVSLLEFPGIKWGATPEEVIAGLGLTEEQIESQTYSDASYATDSCYLTVVNFPFFDKTASAASFEFRNKNGKGYRLFQINLFLDEKANMERVNATLSKAYGEGTGDYYLDYTIDHNGALKEIKRSGDPTLSYLANNLPNGSSGKTMREAVQSIINDPEYQVKNWVSGAKGTDVLTADEQELIVKYWEDRELSDKETVLQWLEKTPLVTVYTANRNLGATLAEAENRSTLATNNRVTYNADMLLYYTELIEFLTGDITPTEPTEAVKPTKSPDLPLLYFPEASWGLEPHQIKEIFELTEDQIITEGKNDGQYILHIKDIAFFDNEVASVQFSFLTTEVGQHHLAEVTLFYPEETDMAVIKNALTEFYIEPKEGNGFTRYRMTDAGTVESYTDYGVVDPNDPGSSAATGWWESSVTLINAIPDKIQERMITRAILLNKNDESRREVVLEYLDKEPAMYICCTDNGNLADSDSPYCTKNVVFFSALEYMQISLGYT